MAILMSPQWRGRMIRYLHRPSYLQSWYEHSFPALRTRASELEAVALDLETTGLNPDKDLILSIGLVPLQGMNIEMNGAWYKTVKCNAPLPEHTVAIHQITDDEAADGLPVREMFEQLLPLLAGKVMIAHNASIEIGFLKRLCKNLYGEKWYIPVIDTQMLAFQTFQRRNMAIPKGGLRLWRLREEYHLPRYQAHHALIDALATAELYTAQILSRDSRADIMLGSLLYQ